MYCAWLRFLGFMVVTACWLSVQAHPINAQRVREGKPPANVVLLRGCGSRCAALFFSHVPLAGGL